MLSRNSEWCQLLYFYVLILVLNEMAVFDYTYYSNSCAR